MPIGVPWLVIETRKTEYRALLTARVRATARRRRGANKVRVYTVGESISPFRLNCLEPCSHVSTEELVDTLLACFEAAIYMDGPLHSLLGGGLDDTIRNAAQGNKAATLADVVPYVRKLLDRRTYDREVKGNVLGAIDTRVAEMTERSVGRATQARVSIPGIRELLHTWTVLELDRVPDGPRCLLVLLLLTLILLEARREPPCSGKLKFLILIEEAHSVLSVGGRKSGERPDPLASVSDLICRMLVELRGLGIGLIISDQHPTHIADSVLKATATHITFRQTAPDDRRLTSDSMLLDSAGYEGLALLGVGEAFLFGEGYVRPVRIRVPNLRDILDLTPPDGPTLRAAIERETWFVEGTRARWACELAQLAEAFGRCGDELTRTEERLASASHRLAAAVAGSRSTAVAGTAGKLAAETRRLAGSLAEIAGAFVRGPYRYLLPDEADARVVGPDLAAVRSELVKGIERVTKEDIERILADANGALAQFEEATVNNAVGG